MQVSETQAAALTWRFARPGLHVNADTGLELRRGWDEETGIEWQIWTRGMGRALGIRPTLGTAKRRAAEIVSQHAEWIDQS